MSPIKGFVMVSIVVSTVPVFLMTKSIAPDAPSSTVIPGGPMTSSMSAAPAGYSGTMLNRTSSVGMSLLFFISNPPPVFALADPQRIGEEVSSPSQPKVCPQSASGAPATIHSTKVAVASSVAALRI